jgi:hypothetical protein
MATGVTDRLWDVNDLVALWEAYEQRRAERAASEDTLTPEERVQMAALVAQIQVEQDQTTFIELVRKLNALLEAREERFNPSKSK